MVSYGEAKFTKTSIIACDMIIILPKFWYDGHSSPIGWYTRHYWQQIDRGTFLSNIIALSSSCSCESLVHFNSKLSAVFCQRNIYYRVGLCTFLKDQPSLDQQNMKYTFRFSQLSRTKIPENFILWYRTLRWWVFGTCKQFWWRPFDTISRIISNYAWQWELVIGVWPLYSVPPIAGRFHLWATRWHEVIG